MKIALIVSGEMRTLEQCVPSFRKHILAPLHADLIECALFVHAAADADAHKAYEFLGDAREIEIETQPDIDERNYIHRTGLGVCGIQSVLRQLWSWQRAWGLVERSGFAPTHAVRLRADSAYFNSIEPPLSWAADTLYVPRFSSFWGVCDRFAFGDVAVMRAWHMLYSRLDELIESGAPFHPESLVRRAVCDAVPGCTIARTDVLFSTVRPSGEIRPPQFMPEIGDVVAV